ncbi:hypothetical protein [Pseudomonas sp. Marseille-Q8238]
MLWTNLICVNTRPRVKAIQQTHGHAGQPPSAAGKNSRQDNSLQSLKMAKPLYLLGFHRDQECRGETIAVPAWRQHGTEPNQKKGAEESDENGKSSAITYTNVLQ